MTPTRMKRTAAAALVALSLMGFACGGGDEIPTDDQQERNVPPGLREEGDPRDEEG